MQKTGDSAAHVALKFLPDEIARKDHAVERFLREARAASALNHSNICTIYLIGELENRPFIVMELLEGRSLQNLLRGRRLSTREVLEIATQTADGLDAAHSKGIVRERGCDEVNLILGETGKGVPRADGPGVE